MGGVEPLGVGFGRALCVPQQSWDLSLSCGSQQEASSRWSCRSHQLRDSIHISGTDVNSVPGRGWVLAYTHLRNTHSSSLVSMWLFVPVPSKQCQTGALCKRGMKDMDRELDSRCRCDPCEGESGKGGRLGARKNLVLQYNSKEVQQGPGGSPSQTGVSQESSNCQA